MVWGAVIGAGASLLGGLLSAKGASDQNKAAQRAAEAQMAFQRESFQNRYQWTMDDMRKAGLNPILAYKQGGGGTLGGSSYSPVNVGAAAVTGGAAGVQSALASRRQDTELKQIRAQTDNIKVDATKKAIEGETSAWLQNKLRNEIKLLKQDFEIRKADVASAKATKQFYEGEGGNLMRKIELIMRSLGVKSAIPARRR